MGGATHVRLVPLAEGRGVDLDDRALDERVRADELVVGGVVLLRSGKGRQVSYSPSSRAGGKAGGRTTPTMRVFFVQCSEPQAKLPESRRRARYLRLPPRTRTVWIRLAPILVEAAVRGRRGRAGGQPSCRRGGPGGRTQRTLTSELELSLLAVEGSLGAGGGPLVAGVSRNSHLGREGGRRRKGSAWRPLGERQDSPVAGSPSGPVASSSSSSGARRRSPEGKACASKASSRLPPASLGRSSSSPAGRPDDLSPPEALDTALPARSCEGGCTAGTAGAGAGTGEEEGQTARGVWAKVEGVWTDLLEAEVRGERRLAEPKRGQGRAERASARAAGRAGGGPRRSAHGSRFARARAACSGGEAGRPLPMHRLSPRVSREPALMNKAPSAGPFCPRAPRLGGSLLQSRIRDPCSPRVAR